MATVMDLPDKDARKALAFMGSVVGNPSLGCPETAELIFAQCRIKLGLDRSGQ
jgi:hypothetical protein